MIKLFIPSSATAIALTLTLTAPGAAADWINVGPGETFACEFSKNHEKKQPPKRTPKNLSETLTAETLTNCATDASGALTEMPPTVPQGNWREQQLEFVNATRALKNRPPLKICKTLNTSAQQYAELMARTGHYDHYGPNGSTPTSRAKKAKYNGAVGENIGYGYNTTAGAMEAWIRSDGHYNNLILPRYRVVGFGVAISPEGELYWTQSFGVSKC